MPAERITKSAALRAARAKLPILGDKKLQEELDYAIGGSCSRCSEARSLAEAFRMGAEAAQITIAARINALGAPAPATAPEMQRCAELAPCGAQCGFPVGHCEPHNVMIPSHLPWAPRGGRR